MKGAISRDELEAIVQDVHHLVQRRLGETLVELEGDFERLLEEWLTEEETRAAWRARYEAGPQPAEPVPAS